MARHAYVDPLEAPGEADLTTHVDFAALARAATAAGARVHGPVTQGAFLRQLGIVERAEALKKRATPEQAPRSTWRAQRLARRRRSEADMGELFKVIAVTHPDTAGPAGILPMTADDAADARALTAGNLALPGVRHAFFTREGGVSEGVYASLNGGVGSSDDPARVAENRARMAQRARRRGGAAARALSDPFARRALCRGALERRARPRCDGLVTESPGSRSASPAPIAACCCSPTRAPA